MISKKLFVVFVLLAIAISVFINTDSANAQYRGTNLYFSGDSVSSGETTTSGDWVSRINSVHRPYYPASSGVRESGVYPLAGYEDIDPYGSAGYVMPNKQNNGSAAIGVANGGGAIGTRALYNMSESEKTSGSPEANAARKQKFFNFLKSKNQSGTAWEKMGSAHIVHQMLRHPLYWESGENSGRTIRDVEWTELERRLVSNPQIWMVYIPGQSVQKNTAGVQIGAGVNPRIDVIDDTNPYAGAVWAFREGASATNSTNVYILEVICANPIGNLVGLPDMAQYSLTPTVTSPADGDTIKRGAATTGSGSVTKTGDDAGTKSWYITRLMYNAGISVPKDARDSISNSENSLEKLCTDLGKINGTDCVPRARSYNDSTNPATGSSLSYTVPADATPGSQICYVASVFNPTQDVNNPVWRHSAKHCITVASPSFNLVPNVGIDKGDGSVVEPGAATEITSSVENTGADDSEGTIWRLTRLEFKPNKILSNDDKSGLSNSSEPCATFVSTPIASDRTFCATAQELSNDQVFPKTSITTFPDRFPFTVPDDAEVGTKICFVVSVSPPTYGGTPNSWRHSAMRCVIVGKKPKMQVWGGDVRAGGRINTSTSTISSLNNTFGSWSEYGALSRGVNVGFSSGAGLAGGGSSAGQTEWSDLTFANVTGGRPAGATCTSQFGCFTHLPLVGASLVGQFDFSSKPFITSTDLNSLNGIYNATNVNLVGTTVQPSGDGSAKYVFINSTGTVTISGDITYSDGPYTSTRQIPQVIIRAPTINIQGNVENVDAWLFAGVLNTCSRDGSTVINPAATGFTLSSNQCNQSLRVNGPVVADKVYLMRTAGSEARDGQRGDPGEIFNLRADAYLWGYGYGSGQSRIQTVHTKELAPRF